MLLTLVEWWQSGDFTMLGVILLLASFAAILFVCLPVHELAHAYAAHLLGDDTAKWYGRLTFNPMKHLDPMGALMILTVGFGYARPVPVNAYNFKNRKSGMALTALAGPVSNLLMAIVAVGLFRLVLLATGVDIFVQFGQIYVSGTTDTTMMIVEYAYMILINVFASINIGLAVFNLLPIPPLDGSRIFAMILPDRFVETVERYQAYISIAFIALIFSGALDPALNGLRHGFGFVVCAMFGMENVF